MEPGFYKVRAKKTQSAHKSNKNSFQQLSIPICAGSVAEVLLKTTAPVRTRNADEDTDSSSTLLFVGMWSFC